MAEYNPFNPNSVVSPTLFAGRVDQVSDICKKLSQLQHNMPTSFFIYGERGIGKTALAKLIKYISSLKDPKLWNLNLLTSYYLVEKGQDINSVLQESLNNLTDQMDATLIQEIGSRLGNIFKNGKFEFGAFGMQIGMEAGANSEKQREITTKDQSVSALSTIIRSLKKSEIPKEGILIIIDEIHNLKDIATAASILRNIVTSLDVAGIGKISFLLIGYEEDVAKFFSVDRSARRTFDLKELGTMPDDDALDVLIKGFNAVQIKYDLQTMKNNIGIAGGYPHSIQLLGHNLIEKDTDGTISAEDWSSVTFDTALELQEKDFSTMYTFRGKQNERDKVLAALAKEDRTMTLKEITEKTQIKNIYRCIQQLISDGAIKKTFDEKYSLHSQLFRTAILFDQRVRKILTMQSITIDPNEKL